MIAITARNSGGRPAVTAQGASARRFEQIRVICSTPDMPSPVARLGAAIVAAADDAGLLMISSRELAAIAACDWKVATTYLRELAALGIVASDATTGYDVAIRVALDNDLLRDEADARARRLREARRQRA